MAQAAKSARTGTILLGLAIALGATLGLGAYTFRYADGLAYLSTDPRACINCHIMEPEFDGWLKSSHHDVAVCVECHLPHEFVPKYLSKVDQGWRHSKAFTLQNFHEPIRLTPSSSRILEANCVRCHADLVAAITPHGRPHDDGPLHNDWLHEAGLHEHRTAGDDFTCVHCHADVGHGERVGLGPPRRPGELPPLPANAPSEGNPP